MDVSSEKLCFTRSVSRSVVAIEELNVGNCSDKLKKIPEKITQVHRTEIPHLYYTNPNPLL